MTTVSEQDNLGKDYVILIKMLKQCLVVIMVQKTNYTNLTNLEIINKSVWAWYQDDTTQQTKLHWENSVIKQDLVDG